MGICEPTQAVVSRTWKKFNVELQSYCKHGKHGNPQTTGLDVLVCTLATFDTLRRP